MIMCWRAALIRLRLDLKSIFKLKWRLDTENDAEIHFLIVPVTLDVCNVKDDTQSVLIRTNAFLQESIRLMDLDAATAIKRTILSSQAKEETRCGMIFASKDVVIVRAFY